MKDAEHKEHKLKLEISENEVRKDLSKAERIDYTRRLERSESLKAEKNRLANLKQNTESQISDDRGRTDESVAEKLGIGSRDTYRKEKFIADNRSTLTPEDFADLDEGKLSTNKAYQKIKAQLKKAKENQLAGGQGLVNLPKVVNSKTAKKPLLCQNRSRNLLFKKLYKNVIHYNALQSNIN